MPMALVIASVVLGLSIIFSSGQGGGGRAIFTEGGQLKFASPVMDNAKPGISVSGTGTVSADPERVDITLGIETESSSAADAEQRNAEIAQKVMDALAAKGLGKDKIETTSFTLQQLTEYDPLTQKNVRKGYQATHMLRVKLADIKTAGDIIDATSLAGANRIDSIQFRLNDDSQKRLQRQALELATKDAADKAQTIASAAGVRIKGLISANEGYVSIPVYEKSYGVAAAAAAPATEIVPGQLQVTASVNLVYEIE